MIWIAIIGAGLGSYVLRVAPLLTGHRLHQSDRLERGLARAGVAALAGVGATAALDATSAGSTLPVLAAMATGAVLAARGVGLLRVIVVGVGVHAITTLLLGT